MFSGIIEAVEKIQKVEALNQALRITVTRPAHFDDLKVGDSIATDGVCLTIESFDDKTMRFTLGFETLKVLKRESVTQWENRIVNLERSLRFGDRVHGHLVTGHVETLGQILSQNWAGESLILRLTVPPSIAMYCWKKGSITINGVSLTINAFEAQPDPLIEVCLIPETIKRTNLASLKVNDSVCLEPDYMARALFHGIKQGVIEVKHV